MLAASPTSSAQAKAGRPLNAWPSAGATEWLFSAGVLDAAPEAASRKDSPHFTFGLLSFRVSRLGEPRHNPLSVTCGNVPGARPWLRWTTWCHSDNLFRRKGARLVPAARKGGEVHHMANAVLLEPTPVKPRLKFHFHLYPPLALLRRWRYCWP